MIHAIQATAAPPEAPAAGTVDLLGCPFCGAAPNSGWLDWHSPGAEDCGSWRIQCLGCYIALVDEETEADAAAKWNRRA